MNSGEILRERVGYLDYLYNSIEYQGHKSKVKVILVLCASCLHHMLEPAVLLSQNVTMSVARWRHFITARGQYLALSNA